VRGARFGRARTIRAIPITVDRCKSEYPMRLWGIRNPVMEWLVEERPLTPWQESALARALAAIAARVPTIPVERADVRFEVQEAPSELGVFVSIRDDEKLRKILRAADWKDLYLEGSFWIRLRKAPLEVIPSPSTPDRP